MAISKRLRSTIFKLTQDYCLGCLGTGIIHPWKKSMLLQEGDPDFTDRKCSHQKQIYEGDVYLYLEEARYFNSIKCPCNKKHLE